MACRDRNLQVEEKKIRGETGASGEQGDSMGGGPAVLSGCFDDLRLSPLQSKDEPFCNHVFFSFLLTKPVKRKYVGV